jgi:tripartite-type tricarboxylate transporter receptor subunit TctC
MMSSRFARTITALLLVVANAIAADTWPTRPIRIVVPFAGGTGTDIVTRVMGAKLSDALGQPVIVENRAGASGALGAEMVAKSPPDGYTLLVGGVYLTTLPAMDPMKAPDPTTTYAAITRWTEAPMMIVVNPSLKVTTLQELFARARSTPGRLSYASSGVGTTPHLVAVMLTQRAGIEMLHVPYSNTNNALKDVLTGEVPVMFTFAGTVDAYLQSGQLRAIAVTSKERSAALPEIPTVAEQGFPGFDVATWVGVLAPAGTPREVIERLHREFERILREPDVRERFTALGQRVDGTGPAQFAADIKADVPRWTAVARAAGLRRE